MVKKSAITTPKCTANKKAMAPVSRHINSAKPVRLVKPSKPAPAANAANAARR